MPYVTEALGNAMAFFVVCMGCQRVRMVADEHARRGKRLALKFALVQMACAAAVALVCLVVSGTAAARAAGVGGLIVAIATVVFAWRLYATSWPPVSVARGFYLGELLKWVWIVGAVWLALTEGGFAQLPLLAGLVAAQIGFWAATGMIK